VNFVIIVLWNCTCEVDKKNELCHARATYQFGKGTKKQDEYM